LIAGFDEKFVENEFPIANKTSKLRKAVVDKIVNKFSENPIKRCFEFAKHQFVFFRTDFFNFAPLTIGKQPFSQHAIPRFRCKLVHFP
jgi:hypothetical protein